MNQRVIADPSQHGWVEVDGKWVWDAESGGAGAGMVISETEPTDKVEGMQWLNPTTGLVLFWDDEKWLQMPTTGAAGKDGVDGLWTDEGDGSISYSSDISVDGNATFTGSVNLAGGGLKYRTASNITLDSDAIAGYLAVGGAEHYSWNATDFRPQTDAQYDLGASNATWKDGFFSGGVYVKGSPLTRTVDLIKTLIALRDATMDETQDIREALRSAIDELVDGLEHEIATMPVPEPEVGTQEISE
jgi:hypothetical protein